MNRFVRQIIYFISVLALFFYLNAYFHKFPNDTHRDFSHFYRHFYEISEKKVSSDVIIIGASIGLHSMRPSYLNCQKYSLFNFSLNGLNASFYLNWYENIFSKNYPKPKYCIYQIDGSALLKGKDDLSRFYRYMPLKLLYSTGLIWKLDYKTFKDLLSSRLKDIIKLNLISIYEKLSNLLDNSAIDKSTEFNPKEYTFRIARHYEFFEKDYDRGFIPFIVKNKQLKERPESLMKEKAEDKYIRDFEALVKKLQSDGIKLIFVTPPEYSTNKDFFELSHFTKFLNTFSKKNNIPFLDYNLENRIEEFSQNPDYFSDFVHLSPLGSKVFSKELKKDLCPLLK